MENRILCGYLESFNMRYSNFAFDHYGSAVAYLTFGIFSAMLNASTKNNMDDQKYSFYINV